MRIDTPKEVDYYKHGGILPFVLRAAGAAAGGRGAGAVGPLRADAANGPADVRPRRPAQAPHRSGPVGHEQGRRPAVFREAAVGFAEVTHDSVGSSVARVKGTGEAPWP